MKFLFEILTLATSIVAAYFWFKSANTTLTKVGPGIDALDLVKDLSSDLQVAARWNYWAATMTGVSVITQVLARAM
jgi:hypothetical protein